MSVAPLLSTSVPREPIAGAGLIDFVLLDAVRFIDDDSASTREQFSF
jgi:hypothetical protein